jgi:hypothetical protein
MQLACCIVNPVPEVPYFRVDVRNTSADKLAEFTNRCLEVCMTVTSSTFDIQVFVDLLKDISTFHDCFSLLARREPVN